MRSVQLELFFELATASSVRRLTSEQKHTKKKLENGAKAAGTAAVATRHARDAFKSTSALAAPRKLRAETPRAVFYQSFLSACR